MARIKQWLVAALVVTAIGGGTVVANGVGRGSGGRDIEPPAVQAEGAKLACCSWAGFGEGTPDDWHSWAG